MATASNTPLSGYVGPVLGADWWKRYLTGNRNWYLAAAAFLLGYLFLFLLGVVANVLGFRGINWFTGFVVQMVVLVVAASWLHFVAVGGLGFIAGQLGGEAGLSAADGSVKAREWLGKLGRFILHLGLNAPVAFYAIAIWPVKDAPFFAFVVLAASASIALAQALIWSEGQFWVKLLFTIHLVIVLGVLAFFSAKAVAPEQSKRLVHWGESRWSVNPADKARDGATTKIRQARINAAKTCYDNLKPDASQADKDRCEALYKAIDESLLPKIAPILAERTTAAGQMNGENQAPAPAPAPAVPTTKAEPARQTTKVETAWNCDTIWKEVDYAPGHQFGKVEIGTLPAGRYEVTVSGRRLVPFFTGTPAVLHQTCEMNPDGHIGECRDPSGKLIRNNNGDPWFPEPTPFGTTGVLIPSNQHLMVPYGMFVLHAWGKALPWGDHGTIHTGTDTPVALDVNNFQAPLNYSGQGSFRVQIKQCQQA